MAALLQKVWDILTTKNEIAGRNIGSVSHQMPKCRFRLDTDTSATLTLADGRKLGYAQYGPLTGRPVFYLHGVPGSRLEPAAWEEVAVGVNARMISVDRPGIGWSSPHPHGTLLDHARDVQQLAEHLQLEQYVVLGGSGGAPYALACAATLPPDRLKGVSVVCGIPPSDIIKRGSGWFVWLALKIACRLVPSLVIAFFQRGGAGRLDLDDATRFEIMKQKLSPEALHKRDAEWAKDTQFCHDSLRLFALSSRQAFMQGNDGVMRDAKLLLDDPGYRLEGIRQDLPVQLWYGKYDGLARPIDGEQIAARLGSRARYRLEEETHSSMFVFRKEEILKDLLACL